MAVSIPLFPTITVAFIRYNGHITALCRHALAWTLRMLLRRKVCVRSTHAYVFTSCTHGKADSVLETFGLYANTHLSLSISPQMCEYASEFMNEHYEKTTCNICVYTVCVHVRWTWTICVKGKGLQLAAHQYLCTSGLSQLQCWTRQWCVFVPLWCWSWGCTVATAQSVCCVCCPLLADSSQWRWTLSQQS